MRNVPSALQSHLNQNATTTCRLLKFRLKSGTVFGITSLDRPVPYDDGSGDGEIVYSALQGFNPSAKRSDLGNTVDNAEVNALIAEDGSGIQLTNIDAGDLDDATWDVYLINFMDTSQGHVHLGAGDVGEVSQRNGMQWTAELLSLDVRLRQPIGGVWSKRCRAIFGSPADSPTGCGVDISGMWTAGAVSSVDAESNRTFTGNAVASPHSFPGRVQFLSGDNAGREFATEEVTGFVISLAETTPYPIQVSDTYQIRPDCAKRFEEDCIGVWSNGPNFKGEPHISTGDGVQNMTPVAQKKRQVFGGLG